MKKLVVLGLAAVMALGAPFSVCAAEEETTVEHPSGLKIGCAVQTMSNQVWAQQMEEITKDAKEDGNEVTVVECKENANTQIATIKMTVLMIPPFFLRRSRLECFSSRSCSFRPITSSSAFYI